MKKTRTKTLQLLNIIGFTGTIIINFLANYLPINGKTTGELSEMYPNLFTPAGITFSIWGVIYLLLAGFIIYQSQGLLTNKRAPGIVDKICWLFFISSAANIGWIFAWHYMKVLLSVMIMLVLLISLIMIYRRLEEFNTGINKIRGLKKVFTKIPFSIYLGWISIATIANITAYLVHINWNGFGLSDVFWTITVIILGLLLTTYFVLNKEDIAYSLVVIWAYSGIIIKRLSVEPQYNSIIFTAAGCILIILVEIMYLKDRKRKSIF